MNLSTDPPDLCQEIRQLLALHRGQWHLIADVTEVSHSWLSKFARGKITNPGYATLKRLHACLRDRPVPARARRCPRNAGCMEQ